MGCPRPKGVDNTRGQGLAAIPDPVSLVFLKKAPQAEATGVCETLCVLHTEGVSFERG